VLFYEARTRRCRLWEADGPPVGVLPTILSADQAVDVYPGDVLLVMSDGFSETTDPAGDMFGIERLEQLLEQKAGQSAGEIQDCFFKAVAAFAQGAPPADDLTICVFKITS
jgi:sigma-B regulation protein RsbU (phosphoserine phosphatase)